MDSWRFCSELTAWHLSTCQSDLTLSGTRRIYIAIHVHRQVPTMRG